MKIKDGFAKRKIAGSNIVVPVGKQSIEFNGMITLNDSGSFFWDCFSKDITIDDAVKMVTDEYEIDAQTARQDIDNFVEMLRKNNLLDE